MGFTEIGSKVEFVSATKLREGQVCIEGWYMGPFQSKYGQAYKFLTKTGKVMGIRDYTIIKNKIEEGIEHMDFTRIVYEGEYRIKNGSYAGNMGKAFRVLVDKSHGEPDANLLEGSSESESSEDSFTESDDDEDLDFLGDDAPF